LAGFGTIITVIERNEEHKKEQLWNAPRILTPMNSGGFNIVSTTKFSPTL
jgi:hypothetical protein